MELLSRSLLTPLPASTRNLAATNDPQALRARPTLFVAQANIVDRAVPAPIGRAEIVARNGRACVTISR